MLPTIVSKFCVRVACVALAAAATIASAAPISFTYTGRIANYFVGTTGLYQVTAYGAQGGNAINGSAIGGLGAKIGGDIFLTANSVLTIAVGGTGFNGNFGGGGGGGSFVFVAGVPMMIAGGGGGADSTNNEASRGGQAGTSGADGFNLFAPMGLGRGGMLGQGGGANTSNGGGAGGGGFLTDGGSNGAASTVYGGKSYLDGLAGGAGDSLGVAGGYGGGGGSTGIGAGGGGGYSGGGGSLGGSAGGGGSYNGGLTVLDRSLLSGVNYGNGLVTLDFLAALPPTGIPEPGSFALLAVGLSGLAAFRRSLNH